MTHKEFWTRMAQRFGRTWYDERGVQPSDEWKATLNKYTPQQILAALDVIETKRGDWNYPPTHSMVGAVLAEVATHVGGEEPNYCREYWRSAVVASMERTGALLGMWRYGTSISAVPEPLREKVLHASRDLLTSFCDQEQQAGHRTPAMDVQLQERVWTTLENLCCRTQRPKRPARGG